jgi:hypothetical protein
MYTKAVFRTYSYVLHSDITLCSSVAYTYGEKWWIGVVMGKVMTVVTDCLVIAHHHPYTGHRRVAFVALKWKVY